MGKVVYLSLRQNSEVNNRDVCLKDIGEVWCSDKQFEKECREINILHIDANEHIRVPGSVMDVIELIIGKREDVQVTSLGENDFIIDYVPKGGKSKLWDWIKTAFVCLIIFFGGAFAIMSFNNDCDVTDIFKQVYKLTLGSVPEKPSILEASYSLGLPIGIIVFFNHFNKKSSAKDPTPLEVQMRNYESDVNNAVIKNSERTENNGGA